MADRFEGFSEMRRFGATGQGEDVFIDQYTAVALNGLLRRLENLETVVNDLAARVAELESS